MEQRAIADLLHGHEGCRQVFPVVRESGSAYADLGPADGRLLIRAEMVVEAPADEDAPQCAQQRKPMWFGELRQEGFAIPELEGELRSISLGVPEERGTRVSLSDDVSRPPLDHPDGFLLDVGVELEWTLRWRHRPAAELVREVIDRDAYREARRGVLLPRPRPEDRRKTALVREGTSDRSFRGRAE